MTEPNLDLPRSSGVLLHVTSLPGHGVGDLGDVAYRWVDWLAQAGQSVWQILPLVPVNEGGSPYNGLSAFAGNAALISPERLVDDGLLAKDGFRREIMPADHVDFPRVLAWKEQLFQQAFDAFRRGAAPHLRDGWQAYRERNAYWLDDYALFRALRDDNAGAPWFTWAPELRRREPGALREHAERLADSVDDHAFRQFLFDRQWSALREHANRNGVRILGDIPIFVAYDSADVWAHQDLFWLDGDGRPIVVSGVPPDYFSETGQRWGNPLYRWDVMETRGFQWWTGRFQRTFEQVDIARVDHFRGFESYWEIPEEEETAIHGRWVQGPRERLFRAVEARLGPLPIVAEDLGLITPEVDALREQLGFPGMRVLQFAFDGDPRNPHLPANYPVGTVAYTGTHDNATAVEWWRRTDPAVRDQVQELARVDEDEPHWDLMGIVFGSRAQLTVVPLQDVLGLGPESRMNLPGTTAGNWTWRLPGDRLDASVRDRLRELTRRTGRLAVGSASPFVMTGSE